MPSVTLSLRNYISIRTLKISIPDYTIGEERFNGLSHLFGAVISLVFYGVALSHCILKGHMSNVLPVTVYSLAMISLYAISGTYHILNPSVLKKAFRILDHCTIFLLIAGCYTPFCMTALSDCPQGKLILAAEWIIAGIGIALNMWNMNNRLVKMFSLAGYVIMGWMIILAYPLLAARVSAHCLTYLLAGGIAYTVGIIFYCTGSRTKYMHCIWHIFVLAGSILQFAAVLDIL